ncbi:MAG: hypothetical protein UU31_C0007G0002 [Candidatus Uhrbacteria bacterium GW2011_GWA2_41_10]|nr:MAG: hypothetical protein UU31_C0007G0002 [Candidatus Uhrbacteria bacterium GW2011_GWA2_41_10]
MSPNSLRNPFHPPDQRTGTPSELTGRFLDSATTQALTEALGEEEEPCESEPQQDLPPADISMSGKEQREVEKESYWTREQYIEWAQEFGRNESWIDKTFEFQKDGTTIVNGNLILRGKKLRQLPIGLMEVKGNFNISENSSFKLNGYPKKVGGEFECIFTDFSSLEGMPEEVGRGIFLQNNKIRSLDGLPDKVMGDLELSYNKLEKLDGISKEISGNLNLTGNNQLTSLEALKGVKIGQNLDLQNIPATEIPAGIEIGGYVYISVSQTDLIADAKRKGYDIKRW